MILNDLIEPFTSIIQADINELLRLQQIEFEKRIFKLEKMVDTIMTQLEICSTNKKVDLFL